MSFEESGEAWSIRVCAAGQYQNGQNVSTLRELWSRVFVLARTYYKTVGSQNLSKIDSTFLIFAARDAEFAFQFVPEREARLAECEDLLLTVLMIWLIIEAKEYSMWGEARTIEWDEPVGPTISMGLFREEARRQIDLGIMIVHRILETEGLFSEDERYPGVTRVSLEALLSTLGAERDKLAANEATVAVIGTMKAGKSTTINGIVGSEVLPSRDEPMTTFPTRVVHVQGLQEPRLTFPLADGFNALVALVADKDREASQNGEDLKLALMKEAAAKDLIGLLDSIRLGTLRFPSQTTGHSAIQELLGKTNDLTRLASIMDIDTKVATPSDLSFSGIPSIEVEFEHLAASSDRSGGRFALVDTPGPNEAGKNERLKRIVQRQLKEASGIVLVLNYSDRGAEAEHELLQGAVEQIPLGQEEHLCVLVNRFDQRAADGPSEAMVKRSVAEKLRAGLPALPENFDERVYPTSARRALRASQAKRAVRLGEAIDTERDAWAQEYAEETIGASWRRKVDQLANTEGVLLDAADLWNQSGFEAALSGTLRISARNATTLLILSALGKLRADSEPVLEMLSIRDSAFQRSLVELQKLTQGLESDLNGLATCFELASKRLDDEEAKIGPLLGDEVQIMIETLKETSRKFLESGEIKVAERIIELRGLGSGFKNFLKWLIPPALRLKGGEIKGEEANLRMSAYQPVRDDLDEFAHIFAGKAVVICASQNQADDVARRITAEIDQIFRHFTDNGGRIVERTSDAFVMSAHEDVADLFGHEWQSVHDRLQEILGLEIQAPKPRQPLGEEGGGLAGEDFTSKRQWSETRWTDVEGAGAKRLASRLMRWWDGHDRHWGQYQRTTHHSEYRVDIDDIREKALARAQAVGAEMDAYLKDVMAQLRDETVRYAAEVERRVQSINGYIIEEIRKSSDKSETNRERRQKTSALAAQARDLVADAAAIHKMVKERRLG